MEKSIETIWKEGFLKSDSLVAPRVNNLYNQKSIHLIDKYKRMHKNNLKGIAIGSLIFLVGTFSIGIPITGIVFFIVLNIVALVNQKLSKQLAGIDYADSSYEFIHAFYKVIKNGLAVNRKMAKFYYPIIFLALLTGFWYSGTNGEQIRAFINNGMIIDSSTMPLAFGIPVIFFILTSVVVGILYLYGGKIYDWDARLIYGRVFKKLEELKTDMEMLRN